MIKTTPTTGPTLIAVEQVNKSFPLPDGKGEFTVLRQINVRVNAGEVVALLGRSGSGKSTLLRIMAGLIPPSEGQVISNGKPLRGANKDVAMVFQSFALLPWLTVQENVELGLEAQGVSREARRQRALKAIDLVGLDGFESAYPKELSGGMKQRVGFARAFVIEPQVLFMDEPFSALDVLTAENLRGEIDDLWNAGSFPSKSILIVTHNIEEAVFLADRVIILGANPGRVRGEVVIDLPRPHDRTHPRFQALVDYIYTVMTNPEAEVTGEVTVAKTEAPTQKPQSPYAQLLPHVRVGGISGLLELIVEQPDSREDIFKLAERIQLAVDDLLPILDAAVLLGFAKVTQGDVQLTDIGRDFATTTILRSKDLFRQQVLQNVPMLASMVQTLREKRIGSMRADFFMDLLDEHFPPEEAERQFATAVDWGRYAELFEYDAREERLYLPEATLAETRE
ncbi:ABC transporter ATP-binding protein [Fischerella thermalis]|uniref:ABC transporter ATP-binding protein n=1 Tax=Fischerella thermalis TaxID=372787 RepID=UPI000C806440|nr:nitrate/sulfonate/bicarbonate ABC transporter ATP-binding protein [Fischerella thermalis]PLZ83199.1 nitrate ABC transporter ATP-binding protein [Fischerella thermalis WC217]PLZ05973.1 nitrate ABC transporter ATP-binding protein [Fischerella thermalis WC114]PLZ13327.1 nitrate ABC transporter ATP-binding protein [Fischerella thermalis WC119]PLZ17474.1 nitrate ABC transporter ATP-binding protein [Fischerella thermalis WC157]PLZ55471.1 nitrate ABC transporter ATP-binding protein [Fischerella th